VARGRGRAHLFAIAGAASRADADERSDDYRDDAAVLEKANRVGKRLGLRDGHRGVWAKRELTGFIAY